MRNLKKIVAVLLTVALLASMMVSALAATPVNTDKALKLQAIKLMAGTEADLRLADSLNRIEGLAFAIRAAGKEAEALAMTDAEVAAELAKFTDSNLIPGWGTKYAAYAIKTGITVGKGNGLLGPVDPLSGPMFLVFVAKAGMGYTEATTAESLIDLVVAAKIFTPAQAVAVYLKSALIRDDAALVLFNAAKTGVNKNGTTLIQSLIDAGFVTQQAAYDAGFAPEAPAAPALEVVSVTADNLIEVLVAFNQEVDEDTAEDETLYSLEDGTTFGSATLQADGKTVKLIVADDVVADGLDDDALSNSTEYTLVIDETLVEASVAFTVVDASLPVAQSIELTGPNTFDITFSEPIDAASTIVVEVEDGIYGAAAAADDTNVVEVTLDADSLNVDNYDVVVSGAEDFAGHAALRKAFTLSYVKDETAPVPTLVSADQTEVVIDFGKTVEDEDGNALTADYFYHSYSSYQPNGIAIDGSEVTLTFTTRPLPEGTVKIVVDYDANDKVITDLWGNEMTANVVLTATIVADNTKPTIEKVVVNDEDEIEIFFSEGLGDGTAAYADNDAVSTDYFVVEQDGEEIDETITNAVYDADDKSVVLSFSADLDGNYTIDVSDIADDAFVANSIADVTVSFSVADSTGINLAAITVDAVDGDTYDTLIVRFPDDMNNSALNKDNYLVNWSNNGFVKLASGDSIAFFNGNDTVKITIADEDAYVVETEAAANELSVMVARLTDSNGNASDLLSATIVADEGDAPVIDKTEMTGYKTVVVTFTGFKLVTAPATGFKIWLDDGDSTIEAGEEDTAAAASLTENDDGDSVVTLTLKSGQQLASSATSFGTDVVKVGIVANKVKADTGKYANAVAVDAADATNDRLAADKMAPKYDDYATADAANSTITLSFSEAIADVNAGLMAHDLVVKNADGDVLVAGTQYTTSVVAGNLVIAVTGVADDANLVGYTFASKDAINYIKDAGTNKAATFAAVEVE